MESKHGHANNRRRQHPVPESHANTKVLIETRLLLECECIVELADEEGHIVEHDEEVGEAVERVGELDALTDF